MLRSSDLRPQELSLLDGSDSHFPHRLARPRAAVSGEEQHRQRATVHHDLAFIQSLSSSGSTSPESDSDQLSVNDRLPALSQAAEILSALQSTALAARNSTQPSITTSNLSADNILGNSALPSSQSSGLFHTLQNELRFWALVSALHTHDFGRRATAQKPVPMDSSAHHARVGELAVGGDATLLLLNTLVSWGNSANTVQVILPSHALNGGDTNTSMASLAAENTRRGKVWMGSAEGVPDLFSFLGPDALEESSDGVLGSLLTAHLAPAMWGASRAAGARGPVSSGVSPPPAPLRCDPDGPQVAGQRLQNEDEELERELTSSLWSLVRSGHVGFARLLAQLYGQPWRSAVLLGPLHPLDTHQRGVPDPTLFASLGFAGADSSDDDQKVAAGLQVVDLVRRGNSEHAAWRRIARQQAARLLASTTPGAEHESAVLALLSGELKALVQNKVAVPSWWDGLWAVAHCALRQKVDHAVSQYATQRDASFQQRGRPSAQVQSGGDLVACDMERLLQVLDEEMASRDQSADAEHMGHSRSGPTSDSSLLGASLNSSRMLGGFEGGSSQLPGAPRLLQDGGTAWSTMAAAFVLHAADPQNSPALLQALVAATTKSALAATVAAAAAGNAALGAALGASARSSRVALLSSALQRVNASFAASGRNAQGDATAAALSAQGSADSAIAALVTPVLRAAAHSVLYLRNHGVLRQLPCPDGMWPPKEVCRGTDTSGHGMPVLKELEGPSAKQRGPSMWHQGDVVIARYAMHLMRAGQIYSAVYMCSQLHHSAGVPLLAHCLAGRAIASSGSATGPSSSVSPQEQAALDPCGLVAGALPALVAIAHLSPLWMRPVVRAAAAVLVAGAHAPPPDNQEQGGSQHVAPHADVPWAAPAGVLPPHVLALRAVGLAMAAVHMRTMMNARDIPSSAPPAWEFAADCVATGNAVSRWLALQVAQTASGSDAQQQAAAAASAALCLRVLHAGVEAGALGGQQALSALLPAALRSMLEEEVEQGTTEEQLLDGAQPHGMASPGVRGTAQVLAISLENAAWVDFVRFMEARTAWLACTRDSIPEPSLPVMPTAAEVHTAEASRRANRVHGALAALREAASALLEPHAQWGLWLSQCGAGAHVLLPSGDVKPSRPGYACHGSNVNNDALAAVGVRSDSAVFLQAALDTPPSCAPAAAAVRGGVVSWVLSCTQHAALTSARWALAAGWPASGGTCDSRAVALGTQESLLSQACSWGALAVDCLASLTPEVLQSAWWAHAPAARIEALALTGLEAARLLSSLPVQLIVGEESHDWSAALQMGSGGGALDTSGFLGDEDGDMHFSGDRSDLQIGDLEQTADEGDLISMLANE